jgi:menaquinone-dependent protoporphyrinogen IX oxidase
MGSIEVYDYNQQKWVPYVPDNEKWYQHFKDLRDGYVQPDHMGRYIVGSGTRYRKLREEEDKYIQRPVVNLVTPVAQAIAIAKSEEEEERKKSTGAKRKNLENTVSKSKRRQPYFYDPDSQLKY